MRKQKKTGLPVSQRDLAAYAGVSGSLLSMAETGKHGNRQLGSLASKRLAELLLAYQQTAQLESQGPSVIKVTEGFAADAAVLSGRLAQNARHSNAHVAVLTSRLADLVAKEQIDLQWLNTVDRILAGLPDAPGAENDRVWLSYQQVIVAERLQKNNFVTQMKLELQICMEKAKCQVYKDAAESLQLKSACLKSSAK